MVLLLVMRCDDFVLIHYSIAQRFGNAACRNNIQPRFVDHFSCIILYVNQSKDRHCVSMDLPVTVAILIVSRICVCRLFVALQELQGLKCGIARALVLEFLFFASSGLSTFLLQRKLMELGAGGYSQ